MRSLRLVVLRNLGNMRAYEREKAIHQMRWFAGKEKLKVEIENIC